MNTPKKVSKAKLIQYKGGGYDGCFWEWNYCLLVDNKFEDLKSSGWRAIKSKSDLLSRYRRKRESFGGQEFYVYDLLKKADCDEFTGSTIADHAAPIAALVNEAMGKPVLTLSCSYCEADIEPMQSKHEDYPQFFHDEQNYHGNGGVGIVFDHVLCENCYLNSCSKCNSIFHPNDEQHEDKNGNSVCEHCVEAK
jgi:hypothetical protein